MTQVFDWGDLGYLIPLGVLGLIRWMSWLLRRLPAIAYRPFVSAHRPSISVVTPVYQEDPAMFRAAVARRPDAPLIEYFDTTLSLRIVDAMSDALACGLQQELGRAGVQLERLAQLTESALLVAQVPEQEFCEEQPERGVPGLEVERGFVAIPRRHVIRLLHP